MNKAVTAFTAVCLMAGMAQAAPAVGTYTAPIQFPAGSWTETYFALPGQAGNVLAAEASGAWEFENAVSQAATGYAGPVYNYSTVYDNGLLTLSDVAPWDGGGGHRDHSLGDGAQHRQPERGDLLVHVRLRLPQHLAARDPGGQLRRPNLPERQRCRCRHRLGSDHHWRAGPGSRRRSPGRLGHRAAGLDAKT